MIPGDKSLTSHGLDVQVTLTAVPDVGVAVIVYPDTTEPLVAPGVKETVAAFGDVEATAESRTGAAGADAVGVPFTGRLQGPFTVPVRGRTVKAYWVPPTNPVMRQGEDAHGAVTATPLTVAVTSYPVTVDPFVAPGVKATDIVPSPGVTDVIVGREGVPTDAADTGVALDPFTALTSTLRVPATSPEATM